MFNPNTTRIVGMHSGMDTDAIVRQMMNAESLRLNRLSQQRTLVQWRQDAYRGVADLLRGFQTTFTGTIGQNSSTSLRMPSNFRTLSANALSSTAGGESSTAIRARALANAALGSFEVNVSQIAQGDVFVGRSIPLILTGDQSFNMGNAMNGQLEAGDQFMVRLDGGNEVAITIREEDLINNDLDPPVRRSLESVMQNINTRLRDTFGMAVNPDGTASTEQKIRIGIQSNGHISFLTGHGHSARVTGGPAGNDALAKLGFSEGGGTTTFDLDATLAETGFFASGVSGNSVEFELNGRTFRFDRSDSLQHVMDTVNNANIGVRMSFDRFRSAFRMESTGTGLSSRINLDDTDNFFSEVFGINTSSPLHSSRRLDATKTTAADNTVPLSGGTGTAPPHHGTGGPWFAGGSTFYVTVNGQQRLIGIPNLIEDPITGTMIDINTLNGGNGPTANHVRDIINAQLDDHFGDGNVRLTTTSVTNASVTETQFSIVTRNGYDVVFTSDGIDPTSTNLLERLGFDDPEVDHRITEETNLHRAGAFRGTQTRSQFTLNGKTFLMGAAHPDDPAGTVRIQTIEELLEAVNYHLAGGDPTDPNFDPSNDTGARMTFSNGQFHFDLTNMELGSRLDIDEHGLGFFTALGFNPNNLGSNSHIQRAQNAMVQVDGTYISRETNTFEVNGVELQISAASVAQGAFTIDVTRDVQPTFDLILNFVEEYNTLLEELNRAHRTPRPRDQGSFFEPLTDEERRELSDREAEMWEERARTGMLFRSDVVSTIHQQLRSLMFAPVTLADGTRLSLHNIGITTSTEGGNIGKLEIDETRLRRALEENPDGILEMFTQSSPRPGTTVAQRNARMREQGIGERLNDIVRNAIDFGGSIFNRAGIEGTSSQANNSLHRELSRHDERIDNMRDFLARRERSFFRMFANMEMAMANANNQMNSIMSMMGMF